MEDELGEVLETPLPKVDPDTERENKEDTKGNDKDSVEGDVEGGGLFSEMIFEPQEENNEDTKQDSKDSVEGGTEAGASFSQMIFEPEEENKEDTRQDDKDDDSDSVERAEAAAIFSEMIFEPPTFAELSKQSRFKPVKKNEVESTESSSSDEEIKQITSGRKQTDVVTSVSTFLDDDDEFDAEEEPRFTGRIVSDAPRQPNNGLKVSFSDLPPAMKDDDFLSFVGDLPPHDYFIYLPPLGLGTFSPSCTAIINFIYKKDAIDWMERLHGWMLTDTRGVDHFINAEIMLNQQIPRHGVIVDEYTGTYKETEIYQEFVQKYRTTKGVLGTILNPNGEITVDLMLREIEDKQAEAKVIQDTPLLSFLRSKNREEERKAKIEREEHAAKIKEAKEKRNQLRLERREKRDRERKERREKERQEKTIKEKKRREAARKERKVKAQLEVKPSTKKEMSEKNLDKDIPTDSKLSENVVEKPNDHIPSSDPTGPTDDSKLKPQRKKESIKDNWRERDKGYERQGNRYKNSSKPWDDRDSWRNRDRDRRDRDTGSSHYNKHEQDGHGSQYKKYESKIERFDVKSIPKDTTGDTSKLTNTDTSQNEVTVLPKLEQSTSGVKLSEDKKEGKKKVVKKIIKVRKVRNTEAESRDDTSGKFVKKIVKQNEKVDSNGGKPSITGDKLESGKSKSEDLHESSKPIGENNKKDEKRKRSRPDIQIYRPGGWRRNSTTTGNGQGNKDGQTTPATSSYSEKTESSKL